MTDWTPDVKIFTLPPNASHDDPRVEVTDWVDYSIIASRGTSEYISPPYPSQTVVTLLFADNVIPEIELGTWIEISVYSPTFLNYEVIHSGYVTNRTSQYRNYGIAGFILEWEFSLTSAISILQNNAWYNETNFTDQTDFCIQRVLERSLKLMWSQINNTLTWENYGPETWEDVDYDRMTTLPTFSYFDLAVKPTQVLTAGWRNTWDDLTTLIYGTFGWLVEETSGAIDVYYTSDTFTSTFTFTDDMLSTNIMGGDRIDQLRNQITMTEFDGVESRYFDNESINIYGERSGTLASYMDTTLDVANVAQTILNGLSYPLLSTEQITVNLLNPIFTQADRDYLLYENLGKRVTVEAPTPMGGTLDYLTIGCQLDITKDSFNLTLVLAPYTQAYNSINWDQVPYNYTWTSYGVAFPTQEWQDL